MAETETWQVSDKAALIYEEKFVPAVFGTWAPVVADAASIAPGDAVLDVACGTGVLAREVARRIGPAGSVTGLDVNEGMLAVARRINPEIDWRRGDTEALPFADESFDAVVCQFALMYFPDRVKALQEMWRVLRPGGRLAVASWAPLDRARGYDVLAGIAGQRTNQEATAVLRAPFVLGDVDELLELYRMAGISRASIDTSQRHARFASVEEFVETEVRGSPMDDLLTATEFDTLLADARNALGDFVDDAGRLRTPIEAHIVTSAKL